MEPAHDFAHSALRRQGHALVFVHNLTQSEYTIQVNFERAQMRSACGIFSQDFNLAIRLGGRVRFTIEFHAAIRNINQL
jgi:hypothetical protein